jgi:CheY-like chemotaxis protein/HPt (histidine-containing phosphotransfer) domain-containing protein
MAGKVLIAEDNLVTQQVLAAMLEGRCEQARIVSTFQEVIDHLNSDTYDVLLLDYNLDKPAAYIVEQVRNESKHKSVSIYIVSAEREADVMPRLAGQEINGFLKKPIDAVVFNTLFPTLAQNKTDTQVVVGHDTLLKSILGDNPDRIQMIKRFFIEEVPAKLDAINNSLNKRDYPTIKTHVHRIRPAFAYLEREDLLTLLETWEEDLIHQRNVEFYAARLEKLQKETARMIESWA